MTRPFDWICRGLTGALMALGLASCGITDPKFVDHGGGGTLSECEKTALETFKTELQPTMNLTCAVSGCHATTTISGQSLSNSDATRNRSILLQYTGKSADTLFNKISESGKTHGGGDRSTDLPKAKIQAWLAKEAACN